MRYEIEATIPTTQYGNIRPKFVIEGEGDESLAMEKMTALWDKYGEKPLRTSTGQIEGNKVKLQTFTSEEILWDEANHKYYGLHGAQLESGSKYAERVSPKFDKANILPKTAKAWGVPEDFLEDMWKLQGDISNGYGTAIHAALDIWHKYGKVGGDIMVNKGLEYNYALPKNKHIRDIVVLFESTFDSDAMTEVLVSDVANLMAGRIDRLQILDEAGKVCRVGDFKTNNDIDDKKLKKYQHQLSFYAHILKNKGWTVQGLDIYHYDGDKWEKKELDVLDLVV